MTIIFTEYLGERYQIRWLTARDPSGVTLLKKKDNEMWVTVDANGLIDPVYFEGWVYDTLTGERFMCDPKTIIIK